jgi:hypothetical protein
MGTLNKSKHLFFRGQLFKNNLLIQVFRSKNPNLTNALNLYQVFLES